VIFTEPLSITDYFENLTIEYCSGDGGQSKEEHRNPEFNITGGSYLLSPAANFTPDNAELIRSRMVPRAIKVYRIMYPIMNRANESFTTGWVRVA